MTVNSSTGATFYLKLMLQKHCKASHDKCFLTGKLTNHILLQGLAAFLKAIGYLIPLMDAEYANYYTREVMLILIREFQSPDEEMKKIVLKVKTWMFKFPKHTPLKSYSYKYLLLSVIILVPDAQRKAEIPLLNISIPNTIACLL